LFLPSAPSAYAAGTTFTYTGSEQIYTVPFLVGSVTITAIGAPGAIGDSVGGPGGIGGDGASVTATVPVSEGETLYVEVGGGGVSGPCDFTQDGPSAFNGGGSSPCGGGGGGASDVRTCSMTTCPNLSPDTRLVVAGGGGGGGAAQFDTAGAGGQGGNMSVAGAGNGGNGFNAANGGAGGLGGTGSPPGTGGSSQGTMCDGEPGSLGLGGDSPFPCYNGTTFGGAGGGGYDGGGAGGDSLGGTGGGGGAGSSYWNSLATDTSMTGDTTGVPEVTITPGPMLPIGGGGGGGIPCMFPIPFFTSASNAQEVVDKNFTFKITSVACPPPTVLKPETLPKHVRFVPSDDGSAMLVGKSNVAAGTYPITLESVNSNGMTTQHFTLVVAAP
jgi:hypothetical protein